MNIKEMQKEIHNNAVAHGWWDELRSFPEILALCHSELSEALEEYRDGNPVLWFGKGGKPEGIAIELADCVIRIMDYCEHADIDLEDAIRIKHDFNLGRPYRHGGKKI